MPKYGFSLTSIFPYKDRILSSYGKIWSEKTRILAYFPHFKQPETRNHKTQRGITLLMNLNILTCFMFCGIFLYIYDIQFIQENKIYNRQVL